MKEREKHHFAAPLIHVVISCIVCALPRIKPATMAYQHDAGLNLVIFQACIYSFSINTLLGFPNSPLRF